MEKIWDVQPVCLSPEYLNGKQIVDLDFEQLCSTHWASMVNLIPRARGINITRN